MSPLQRASVISVTFMLTVMLIFMICVAVFFWCEWRKRLLQEQQAQFRDEDVFIGESVLVMV